MAADLPALETAIISRVDADTGAGGLKHATSPLIQQVYDSYFPEDHSTYPYVVFVIANTDARYEALRTMCLTRDVDFHVYVPRTVPAGDSYSAVERGANIMDRLLGDWQDQAYGTAPTYGFNRFKPTLSGTSWVSDIFMFTSSTAAHEDEYLHWVMTFQITNSLRAP